MSPWADLCENAEAMLGDGRNAAIKVGGQECQHRLGYSCGFDGQLADVNKARLGDGEPASLAPRASGARLAWSPAAMALTRSMAPETFGAIDGAPGWALLSPVPH